MSERFCIRGCTHRDRHMAACPEYGLREAYERAVAAGVPNVSYVPRCWGCAPRECRDGSLICDRCFGRMRALLADGPDLLGRVRSLADPGKATPTDKEPGGVRSSEPPAPVSADYLDALVVLEQLTPWWHVTLSDYSNDLDVITWLGAVVLDEHPEVEGIREAWSVADVAKKWGPERRTKGEPAWSEPEESTGEAVPIPEWGDPIVGWPEAARIAGSDSTLRRWVKREEVAVAGTFVIAGIRTRMFRREELLATRKRLGEKQTRGLVQNQTTNHEIGGQSNG
ncbi:hypothetical protein MHM582_2068 [Microbacterium sp. HM58-2]|nr:hypothetical protein MHM582_2068 [Microbacterium sp. HM58-2]